MMTLVTQRHCTFGSRVLIEAQTVSKELLIALKVGTSWYSGSALDCWSTGLVIDFALETQFITKFISLAQVDPGPVYSIPVQIRGLEHHSFVLEVYQ